LRVRQALEEYIRSWETLGSPWEEVWIGRVERARRHFAALIGASPHEVAVVPSVSSGLHSLLSALDYHDHRRNKIVLTDLEFPTVAFIWQAQQRRGAKLHFVPSRPDGTIDLADLERAIDSTTLAVQLTRVCYKTGYLLPVEEITHIAHRHGALVFLDDYQACGAVPIDVKSLGVDVLVTGALKYLLGSQGLAFLYVRPELIPQLEPIDIGWFAHKRLVTGFDEVGGELHMKGDAMAFQLHGFQYADDARRFEAGTPAIASAFAAAASIEMLLELGTEAYGRIQQLVNRTIELANERRWALKTPTATASRSPLVVLATARAQELVGHLKSAGIVTSSRDNGLRLSFHAYNNEEDVDRAFEALERHSHLLAQEIV
jgi:selenocysteine lyase/cysteine desulfurase